MEDNPTASCYNVVGKNLIVTIIMTCSQLCACRLYQCNVCGEGGEYESLVLDCPFFKKARIVLDQWTCILHSPDIFSLVGLLQPVAFHLEAKTGASAGPQSAAEQLSRSADQGSAAEQPPRVADEELAAQQPSRTADGQSAVQRSSHTAGQRDPLAVQQSSYVAGQPETTSQDAALTPAAAESCSAQLSTLLLTFSSLTPAPVIEVPQDFPGAVQTAVEISSSPAAVPAAAEDFLDNGEDYLEEDHVFADQTSQNTADMQQQQHGQEPSSSQLPQATSEQSRADDEQSSAVVEQGSADAEQDRADAERDRADAEQDGADAEQTRADEDHASSNTSSASAISATNSPAWAQHEPSMDLAWNSSMYRPYDFANNILLQQGAAYLRAVCVAKRGPDVAGSGETTATTLDYALQNITTGTAFLTHEFGCPQISTAPMTVS